ncbi:NAD(P)-binding domain-containing protein [Rhabdothermincola salaria]|uniref:NAD(P)-binding domain-containing protein n=1 Tax=Rhabdothermincola salaria TaxID=2903142 RepID=UPI001E51BC8E|nr:NAD(P)-binding domain-containing protein [Rhabdothermincola salaria]MCD9623945.1 NAD(P)-binding domain-containing protein [Rhabdothermincola salaria]
MSVAVIGLGNIGLAIGRRLTMRGQEVVGVELSELRRTVWTAMTGLEAVERLDDVDWRDVTRVLVVVRLTEQAEEVLEALGRVAEGRVAESRPLTAFVVTTLEAEAATRLDRFATDQLRLVELPVSGGEFGALAGNLTVMGAGPLDDEDEAFLLSTIASKVVRFDGYGQPTMAKLVNNVLAAYNTAALAEMLRLADEVGLDAAKVYEVVLSGSGGSWMAGSLFEIVVDLLEKDVGLLQDRLGGLPRISVEGDGELTRALDGARRLFAGPTT